MWGSRAKCASVFESHPSECVVCAGSPWAPCISRLCVWELLVLWDRPAVWEWGAGIIRTPCCSSNICSPAVTNQREELGAATNRPARWSFQGILVEGLEQKPTPTTPKPSPLHPPSPSSPRPSGFDILDPCVEEYPPLFKPPHTHLLHTNNPMDHDRKMTLGLVSWAWLTYIYIALREAACVLSFPTFHMINSGRSHAGISRASPRETALICKLSTPTVYLVTHLLSRHSRSKLR